MVELEAEVKKYGGWETISFVRVHGKNANALLEDGTFRQGSTLSCHILRCGGEAELHGCFFTTKFIFLELEASCTLQMCVHLQCA